jgi:hypothetical protein
MADSAVDVTMYTNAGRAPVSRTVREFRLEQHPFAHDIAKIEVQGSDDTSIDEWDTGTPLTVVYGRRPNKRTTFYGYMLGPQPTWRQTERNTMRNRRMTIWAVGASWPLKQGLSTSFHNKTAAQMAASVLSPYFLNLQTVTSPQDYVWPMRNAVNGRSAWEFLVDLAKDSGKTCRMNGTTLNFYDPTTALLQPSAVVPAFYEKDGGKGMTVLDFTPDNSEVSYAMGAEKRTRVFQSLDSKGNSVYLSDDGTEDNHYFGNRYRTPLFTEYVEGLVAHSPSSAAALLPPRTTANRFYIRARATLAGDIRVMPDTPILLDGLGTRDSGLWQVLNVTHHLKWHYYALEVELGRDSDGDTGVRPSNVDGIDRSFLSPIGNVPLVTPPTVIANGFWRAAYLAAA